MRTYLFAGCALAGTLLAACGSSSYGGSAAGPAAASSPSGAPTAGALVKTATNSSLGATVLVDGRGLTLYALSAEHAGHFVCTTSACTSVWHPLAASGTPAGSVGSLGAVRRPDGSEQVTYMGKPLYTFAQDKAAGQAAGQGFKDVGTWSAVVVAGGSSGAGTSSTGSSGSGGAGGGAGGGYHY